MLGQTFLALEIFATFGAFERSPNGVHREMCFQTLLGCEGSVTLCAVEWFLTTMHLYVSCQTALVLAGFVTFRTLE